MNTCAAQEEHLCSTRGTTFQHSQKEIIVLKKTSPQQEKIPFYVSFNWQLIWRPCGGCSCQLWPSAVLIHRCLQPWLDTQLTTVWEYSCPLFWTSTVSWFEPLFSAISCFETMLQYLLCRTSGMSAVPGAPSVSCHMLSYWSVSCHMLSYWSVSFHLLPYWSSADWVTHTHLLGRVRRCRWPGGGEYK